MKLSRQHSEPRRIRSVDVLGKIETEHKPDFLEEAVRVVEGLMTKDFGTWQKFTLDVNTYALLRGLRPDLAKRLEPAINPTIQEFKQTLDRKVTNHPQDFESALFRWQLLTNINCGFPTSAEAKKRLENEIDHCKWDSTRTMNAVVICLHFPEYRPLLHKTMQKMFDEMLDTHDPQPPEQFDPTTLAPLKLMLESFDRQAGLTPRYFDYHEKEIKKKLEGKAWSRQGKPTPDELNRALLDAISLFILRTDSVFLDETGKLLGAPEKTKLPTPNQLPDRLTA